MNNEQVLTKQLIRKAVVIGLVLLAAVAIRPMVLGGASIVTLDTAPPLTGQVAQALANQQSTTLPKQGVDFELTDTHYFDNNKWVLVQINALNNTMDDGIVVFKNESGIYTLALGPTTTFASTQLEGVPADLAAHLQDKGMVYEPR